MLKWPLRKTSIASQFLHMAFIFLLKSDYKSNSRTARSSRPKVFCKKGVLRNFTKFTGIHLCQSLFFNKVAGFRSATLLKKRLWHRCFPENFVKFLRTPFLQNTFGRLLLAATSFNEKSS